MPRGNGSREVVKKVDGLHYDGVSEKGIGLVYRYPRSVAILRLDSPYYENCIMPNFEIRFPWSSKELSKCFEIAWRLVGSANAASANKCCCRRTAFKRAKHNSLCGTRSPAP